MAIVKTHLYTISFEHDQLMKVLIQIHELKESLYPQDSKKIANNVKGVSVMDSMNPYNEIVDYTYHVLNRLEIEKKYNDYNYEEIDIKNATAILDEVTTKIDNIASIKENILKERDENQEALLLLRQLEDAKLNIDEIKDCKYITCRFGKLPISEKEKIKYYREYPFIFKEISRNQQYIWGLYAGLTKNISEVDNVFYSMSFEEVEVPHFIHGTSLLAIEEIVEENKAMDNYIEDMQQKINTVKVEYQEQLLDIFTKVSNLKQLYDQCKYVVDFLHKAEVYAFSLLDLSQIQQYFKNISSVKILELPVTIYDNRGIHSPIILNNNRLVKPFEGIVPTKIGDTIDATPIVAAIMLISSALLLGDISIGIVITLLGILLGIKKKSNSSGICKRIGIAILIGGLLYGRALYMYQCYLPVFTLPFSLIEAILAWIGVVILIKVVFSIVKKCTRKIKST